MKLTRVVCTASAAGLLSSSIMAGTMGPIKQVKDWTWVGTISIGPVWESGGRAQSFYLTPDIEKTYTADKSTHTLFEGELFAGIQKRLSDRFQGQLGLAVGSTRSARLSGHIWDDANAEFDNFSYQYKVQHTYVAVKAKVLADVGYWAIPWISASLGAGFNDAHAFYNTPLIFQALPMANFNDHTTTSFTYTVSAGVQKAINSHWQVGVGYEFADWGKSALSRAPGQTMGSGLSLNHLYTNGVLFNISYLA